ncbi:MAG: ABC transporter permease [Chloroflexi bacterium]|nr:ABC transporter permease [Chloroflexota bacterium]
MRRVWHHLRELAAYRELLINLVVRDLKVRYKNSVFGFLWSLLNPLLLMLVFKVIFTVVLPNVHVPHFPVFVLSALLPWNFFSTSLVGAIHSISGNGHLIKRVYFPREVLTISSVLGNLVNFILALLVLIGVILFSGLPITRAILYLPLVIAVHVAFTLGVALALAMLNVFYRDTGVIIEVLLQAWFFVTPVFYPIELLPQWINVLGYQVPVQRLVYILNPMASIIATYRSVLYGSIQGAPPGPPGLDFFTRTAVTAFACFVVGYALFGRYSTRFAEEV